MSVLKKRDFAALLDDLLAESASESRAEPSAPSVDYLAVADELYSGRIVISPDYATAAYAATGGDEVLLAESALDVLERLETDPDAIARELGLADGKGPDDLDGLRRRFAMKNHPDRVDPEIRAHAMIRMQIANMLIDQAKLARAARQARKR